MVSRIFRQTTSLYEQSKSPLFASLCPEPSLSVSAFHRAQALCADAQAVIVVFYRGIWCPFSTTWGRGMSSIRLLGHRLEKINTKVLFVSAEQPALEREAASHLRFTNGRGGDYVHFINDPQNEIAQMLNTRYGTVVSVEHVSADFASGIIYPHGMTQPALIAIRNMFSENEQIIQRYMYKSDGLFTSINADDNRPPACSTLRNVEHALQGADQGERKIEGE